MSDELTVPVESSTPAKSVHMSPLLLIRQAELEISGRVLAARRESDAALTAARKQASEIVARASEKQSVDTSGVEKQINAEADVLIAEVEQAAQEETRRIGDLVEQRREAAVGIVLDLVLGE